ncbi:hypothetical protein PRJ39_25560 [Lysobacter enzymogenes]|uniref:hypothetical protein n=1 Tax=Lysobacter enzymogenes TaxID=69 RepID=UPI0037496D0B
MRALPFLTLGLLLAAGPALAGGGNDFCDSLGTIGSGADPQPPPTGSGDGPHGGRCQVDMVVAPTTLSAPAGEPRTPYWALRDLPFTPANLAVLSRMRDWPRLPFCLEFVSLRPPYTIPPAPGGGATTSSARSGAMSKAIYGPASGPIAVPAGPAVDSTFLEWSFEPEGSGDQRLLTLTLVWLVERYELQLRADWVRPRRPNWSYADAPSLPAQAPIATVAFPLRDSGRFTPKRITLNHDSRHVYVAVGDGPNETVAFDLPADGWHPVRLRNGLVHGSELSTGMGMKMTWPTLVPETLNQDAPAGGAPGNAAR